MRGKAEGVARPHSGPPVTLAEADLAPYLTPDIVLPTQRGSKPASGEHWLLVALVVRGVEDACNRRGTLQEDALSWILSGAQEPFSFEACCEVLGVSAGDIRRQVRARVGG